MKTIVLRALRKLGILKKISFNTEIELNGKKWIIPVINEVGFNNYLDLSEPWMQFLLENIISDPQYDKAFVDVGVNVGQTLLKVKAVNSTIHYLGFEPNPLCVNYINTLIKANKLINTEIVPTGISNTTSILKLQMYTESVVDSSASIIEGFRGATAVTNTISVPVFRYADLALDIKQKIGMIKIDVEGAELEVLEGFYDQIKTDRPTILIEILPAYGLQNKARIDRQRKIEELLATLDYHIFRIVKEKNRFIALQELTEIGIHADLNLSDYLLLPTEDKESIKKFSTVLNN